VTAIVADATVSTGVRDLAVISARRIVSDDVVEFTLRRPDGSRLPDWTPGAHIDLTPQDGTTRQYSLCGDRWDTQTYRIAVQREADGAGGSILMHDTIHEGSVVRFGGPRNNFRLAPAATYLFIAGGIGITPILPMITQADLLDADWRLLYLGRTRTTLAYESELALHGDRVTVHCADEAGRAELESWRPSDPDVRIYACGPARLLDTVEAWGALPGGLAPRIERFAAPAASDPLPAVAFEVIARRSGTSTTVAPDETLVTALHRIGVEVLTSCGQGVCGTCETDVLDGRPQHRDSLLDDIERAAGSCMFPCVSRSLDKRLVLDL